MYRFWGFLLKAKALEPINAGRVLEGGSSSVIFVFATVLSHLKMKAAAVVNKSAIFCLFVCLLLFFSLDESINDEIALAIKILSCSCDQIQQIFIKS